jgi:hypothetical protein
MKFGSVEFNVLWRTIWELCAVLAVCVVIGGFAAATMTLANTGAARRHPSRD